MMEAKEPKLGSSLLTESVKEIALTTVAERYFQPELPVIDLNKLLSEEVKGSELQKLHLACKQWGFFQLVNHGVGMKLVEDVKRGAEELFKLPMEEKKKLWQKPGDMEGFGGTLGSKEASSDWVHVFYILTLPTHLRNQHLFPNIPLPFR
ncbi:protein SRG1-like [Vigna radiata var. radiata]|uniref:Protein SRG1-like n=1 Tax=Vigna radiata var. radiata TaxID=3916 RepID=A0A1S3VQR8_VIGRR|nr:protein SRG1-like [Vigna radiata var. radiata]